MIFIKINEIAIEILVNLLKKFAITISKICVYEMCNIRSVYLFLSGVVV